MPDFLSPAERSVRMARVGAKNTEPELRVRRLAHRLGYRFRLHRRDLPGKPDIVFPGRRKIVLVNGCFWHGHEGCRRASRPETRREFWAAKIDGNAARDARNLDALTAQGWSVLTVWECESRDLAVLAGRLHAFLGPVRSEAVAAAERCISTVGNCGETAPVTNRLRADGSSTGAGA